MVRRFMSWKLGEEKKKGVSSATVLTAAAAARFVCGDDGDGYDKTGTIMAVLDSIDVCQCLRVLLSCSVPAFRSSDADNLAGDLDDPLFPRAPPFTRSFHAISYYRLLMQLLLGIAHSKDCEPLVDLTTRCHDATSDELFAQRT